MLPSLVGMVAMLPLLSSSKKPKPQFHQSSAKEPVVQVEIYSLANFVSFPHYSSFLLPIPNFRIPIKRSKVC